MFVTIPSAIAKTLPGDFVKISIPAWQRAPPLLRLPQFHEIRERLLCDTGKHVSQNWGFVAGGNVAGRQHFTLLLPGHLPPIPRPPASAQSPTVRQVPPAILQEASDPEMQHSFWIPEHKPFTTTPLPHDEGSKHLDEVFFSPLQDASLGGGGGTQHFI